MSKVKILSERSPESSVKWSQCGAGRIPMGVADMDFKMDERIISHLQKFAEAGDFGYSTYQAYEAAVTAWMKKRFDWDVPHEWITFCPGTLSGIAILINMLSEKGDAVMIFSPVYNRFFDIIRYNGRKTVECELINNDSRYEIDFQDMEEKIAAEKVKVLILSSPHNPVCRIWSIEEQRRITEICRKHSVIIISDEIHADLTLPGHVHSPFLKNNMDYSESIIVTTSPSKAFNMPGLYMANFIIPDESIRKSYLASIWSHPNLFGAEALKKAYEDCEDWLEDAVSYIAENYDFLENFISVNIPGVKLIRPEATYLAWLDCRSLDLTQKELMELFLERAGLYVSSGTDYGDCGLGYIRMNIACSRETLERAMTQLMSATESLTSI